MCDKFCVGDVIVCDMKFIRHKSNGRNTMKRVRDNIEYVSFVSDTAMLSSYRKPKYAVVARYLMYAYELQITLSDGVINC